MKILLSLALFLTVVPLASAQTSALLTSGAWKLTGIGFDYEGDGKMDRDLWKTCRQGTTFTFNADGTGANYKGPQPCGNPGANPLAFTWKAIGATTFTMLQGPNEEGASIRSIAATSLVLYMSKSKLLLTFSK